MSDSKKQAARQKRSSAAPNFDALASAYRWMEVLTFGPWLWRCRCAFLGEMLASRHALVLGDGDGRFTARLLAENTAVEVDAIDASSAMLRSLVRRAGADAARLRVEQADLRCWPGAAARATAEDAFAKAQSGESLRYDLIVTHFFLDCLTTEEIQELAMKLRRVAMPSAVWIVSEFAIPAGWYGRLVAAPLVWALYRIFGWLTGLAVRSLPDHRAVFEKAGFTILKRRAWLSGLLVSEVWSVSKEEINGLSALSDVM